MSDSSQVQPTARPAAPPPERAEPPVLEKGVTVEFAYASVAAFEQAAAVARKHASCRELGEGKNRRLRATYRLEEELDAIKQIKEAAWELRHKRVWLNGQEVEWFEMAQMTHCLSEYVGTPRRQHCFFDSNFWSGFGCRYVLANLTDRINNEWLTWGRLDQDAVWVFDKARIAAYVRQTVSRGYQHCPAWDAEYLEHFLAVFPEKVDPNQDERWRFLHKREGGIIGVVPKDVDTAKKIVYELQAKIVARRGQDKIGPNGKRPLPAKLAQLYAPAAKRKKSWFARLFG